MRLRCSVKLRRANPSHDRRAVFLRRAAARHSGWHPAYETYVLYAGGRSITALRALPCAHCPARTAPRALPRAHCPARRRPKKLLLAPEAAAIRDPPRHKDERDGGDERPLERQEHAGDGVEHQEDDEEDLSLHGTSIGRVLKLRSRRRGTDDLRIAASFSLRAVACRAGIRRARGAKAPQTRRRSRSRLSRRRSRARAPPPRS